MKQTPSRNYGIIIAVVLLALGATISSGAFGVNWNTINTYLKLPTFSLPSFGKAPQLLPQPPEKVRVSVEESVIIDAVDHVSPSVVTVGITKTTRGQDMFEFDPFDPFTPFRKQQGQPQKLEQDIGSGFIIDRDGLIVTNKHVVSDTDAKYRIITKDDKSFDVQKIYRDPTNDLAILKVNATGLQPIEMGDSDKIKVGQLAIAIGTALGQFRQTVTVGVVSGVGRGITAGGPFEGSAERLDNVIQTDAAINPGNSGGPLLNSAGQVVGVNVAVSAQGQNIGFALPINVVKDAVKNFEQTGSFNRPYLGIRYKTISKDIAILNDVPEGAYIIDLLPGSPAAKAGLKQGDIITKIDDTRLSAENAELARAVSHKKVGETVALTVYRDGRELSLKATLANQADQ